MFGAMNRLFALVKRYGLPLLAFNSCVIAAITLSISRAPKVWTATTQLILPENTSQLAISLGSLGSYSNSDPVFSSMVNPLKTQISILTSEALLQKVWQTDPEKSKFKTVSSYGALFKAVPQDQAPILQLSTIGSNPKLARQRATALIRAYQDRLNQLRQENRSTREQLNREELEQARQRLQDGQMALAEFRSSSGLVNPEEQVKGMITTINTLVAAQAQALAQVQSSNQRVNLLSGRLGLNPEQALRSLGLGENQDYQLLRTKLVELEAKLVQSRSRFTDESKVVQTLLIERQDLQQQIRQYVAQAAGAVKIDPTITANGGGRALLIQQLVLAEADATSQRQLAETFQKQIVGLNATLRALPKDQARLVDLQRQIEISEGVYKGLITQTKKSSLDAFNAYPSLQILDPPSLNPAPTRAKPSVAVVGGGFALILGSLAIVLLLEARSPLLRPQDLQQMNFPFVWWIPRQRQAPIPVGLHNDICIEFQRLASALSLQPLEHRRLLITSASSNEGKTTVTLGLAIALTQLGFRVLVVDGDLRQADLSRRLAPFPESAMAEPIQLQPSLSLLATATHPDEMMEFVTPGKFEQLLNAAESTHDYDFVLIDSASVSCTIEPVLMASIIQNVLFVVRPDCSDRKVVKDSIEQLRQHHARFIGLVVNDLKTKSKSYPPPEKGLSPSFKHDKDLSIK